MENFIARQPRPRIAQTATFSGYRPSDLERIYGFPAEFDGTGTVAVLLEFGSGFSQTDLDAFCTDCGLPPCRPVVVSVNGGANDGGTSYADMEGTLDVQWLHAAAPGATIYYLIAPNPTSWDDFAAAMVDALRAVSALPKHADVVSISYGDAEGNFPAPTMQAAEAEIAALVASGTQVFVATGDQGAFGTHDLTLPRIRRADWPATCPSATAVGGTTIQPTQGGAFAEIVWMEATGGNGATGGGYSEVFPRPAYQDALTPQNAMRGIPDLSADADPTSGYVVVFEGQPQVIGGTSASTPLVAGLFARIVQARRAQGLPDLTDTHAETYRHPAAFRDITWGINSFNLTVGYNAGTGWDAASGMGAPIGTALVQLFAPVKVTPAPAIPSTIPVYINGAVRPYVALLRGGMAYVPVVDVARDLGAAATRDLKGVYITTAKTAATTGFWARIFGA